MSADPPSVFFGVTFQHASWIASAKDVEEICKFIGVDSLGYLSIEGMLAQFRDSQPFCTACFSGEYPLDVNRVQGNVHWKTLCHC